MFLKLLLNQRDVSAKLGSEASIDHASLQAVVGNDGGDGVESLEGLDNGGIETQDFRWHAGKFGEILVGDDEEIVARHLEESVSVLGVTLADERRPIAVELPPTKNSILMADYRSFKLVVSVNIWNWLFVQCGNKPPQGKYTKQSR